MLVQSLLGNREYVSVNLIVVMLQVIFDCYLEKSKPKDYNGFESITIFSRFLSVIDAKIFNELEHNPGCVIRSNLIDASDLDQCAYFIQKELADLRNNLDIDAFVILPFRVKEGFTPLQNERFDLATFGQLSDVFYSVQYIADIEPSDSDLEREEQYRKEESNRQFRKFSE